MIGFTIIDSKGRLNIKMPSYQNMDSHYLYYGNPHT